MQSLTCLNEWRPTRSRLFHISRGRISVPSFTPSSHSLRDSTTHICEGKAPPVLPFRHQASKTSEIIPPRPIGQVTKERTRAKRGGPPPDGSHMCQRGPSSANTASACPLRRQRLVASSSKRPSSIRHQERCSPSSSPKGITLKRMTRSR